MKVCSAGWLPIIRVVRLTQRMDVRKALKHGPIQSEVFEYKTRDVILYALGVGATVAEDLRYLYENDTNFNVLPTFIVVPGLLANTITDWPGIEFDLSKILHGEHFIEMFAPLPTDGKLISDVKVIDILDKGSGALILSDVTTYDAISNQKIARQQFSAFQLGAGNFGGSRKSENEVPSLAPPRRPPDACIEQKTTTEQAALYRLGSGDVNPLHIDADFAQMAGFDRPILHGLCSLGFSVRHILQAFANNDAKLFGAVKARFSSPVIPGQTLCTQMWREGNRIHFETLVKENGMKAISNAYLDLETSQLPLSMISSVGACIDEISPSKL